ncbi:hypothetical protein, partial [Vibrio parahaemolyticus]
SMKVVATHNNWLLYSDGESYILNSRCDYGIGEETATFLLKDDEVSRYLKLGEEVIHELSDSARSSSGKHYYEKQRPVSDKLMKEYHKAKSEYIDKYIRKNGQ